MNNITNDILMPVTDVYSETSLWRGCSCLLCNTHEVSSYSNSRLSETPSIYESAPNPFDPDNNITGNPYLDSLIWGGSWDLSTNYGGPAGTITYSFVPYYVSDHEFYDWYDWEKVDSTGNKIPNSERMQTEHVIVNSVHDSIVVDVPSREIQRVSELFHAVFHDLPSNFKRIFGVEFNLPLLCEVQYGPNMKELIDV